MGTVFVLLCVSGSLPGSMTTKGPPGLSDFPPPGLSTPFSSLFPLCHPPGLSNPVEESRMAGSPQSPYTSSTQQTERFSSSHDITRPVKPINDTAVEQDDGDEWAVVPQRGRGKGVRNLLG